MKSLMCFFGLVLSSLIFINSAYPQRDTIRLQKLKQEVEGSITTVWNQFKNSPSFIRGRMPLSQLELKSFESPQNSVIPFVNRYSALFRIEQADQELQHVQTISDDLGLKHSIFNQVHKGIRVYGATLKFHFSADNQYIVAINNGYIPEIQMSTTVTEIRANGAIVIARRILPSGELSGEPELMIYAGGTGKAFGRRARIAWFVDLADLSIPMRNLYVIDANSGDILDIIPRLYNARNRQTYNANNTTSLPGTLARSETDPPTGDVDIDNAHNFAGDTYDYYFNTFGRDSYDNNGAPLISVANYGSGYANAFWDGSKMVYGDGYTIQDIAAHELTHAVTERTSNLEYRWQSGALNESFSDIFGVMVDRNDWLMGEDLPGGAIRSLSNPSAYGDPEHAQNWVQTCSDYEGVHTNSGITNKAFYNIATALGKNKAEIIFYRTLTVYLNSTSSLEDCRAGAIQSAIDLYGLGSAENSAVINGFNAVGLNGTWNPPANNCFGTLPGGICAAQVATSDVKDIENKSFKQVANTLYDVRNKLFTSTDVGRHFNSLYKQYSIRMAYLFLQNSELRSEAGQIIRQLVPGLMALTNNSKQKRELSEKLVNSIQSFLLKIAKEDRFRKETDLAETIEQEITKYDWNKLSSMTFQEAWSYFNNVYNKK